MTCLGEQNKGRQVGWESFRCPSSEFRGQFWREALLECNASSHQFETRGLEVLHNRVFND
jgi:hypothetical protein